MRAQRWSRASRTWPLPQTTFPRSWTSLASERIDQTIVGPETPLVLGVTDAFEAAGLRCFGPRRLAARLEGSKAFTKDFLSRHRIPTAAYATFTQANFDAAWVRSQRAPLVVKADGLAAGKGVIICETTDEAVSAAEAMFSGQFGAAGNTVVIEEFLRGEEASFIAIVSGEHILPLATSQDHKRRDDGDRGPNTGGMGAYSPAPVVTDEIHQRVMREVMQPTVRGLIADGTPYIGFLYAGLMIAAGRHAERARIQLPLRRPRDTTDHDAARVGPDGAVRRRARRPAGSRRGEMGSARRTRRRAGRRRLSRLGAQGRRDPRPGRRGEAAGQGVPRGDSADER